MILLFTKITAICGLVMLAMMFLFIISKTTIINHKTDRILQTLKKIKDEQDTEIE